MNLEDLIVEKDLKIVFMGTPEFSTVVLKGILENYKVRAVVCQADREKDRHGNIIIPPVKKLAIEHQILVLQPTKIREDFIEILNLEPDLIITCAYGQIIPKQILDYPRLGCINVHSSLLPLLRGGAPIERAIMNGHSKTGVTIMYMDEGMDSGDIITQEEIPIESEDTGSTLRMKLAILGRDLLLKTLPSIIEGTNKRTKQDSSLVTYAPIIKKEDERIFFNKTKRQIKNKVRALNNRPGAYCIFSRQLLKIWKCRETDNVFNKLNGEITAIYPDGFGVKVSNGELVITEVQLAGKKRMSAIEFLNGLQDKKEIVGRVLE
ncbi:MAG: methionyl-tRNA formyltransferase [Bacilli bacterium]|nr:methionyl-tRNA formyltransferase [Bacilli bacterium]